MYNYDIVYMCVYTHVYASALSLYKYLNTCHTQLHTNNLHNIFKNTVNNTITKNLINVVLYNPLYKSIIICINENPKYNKAGPQKFSNAIYNKYRKYRLY